MINSKVFNSFLPSPPEIRKRASDSFILMFLLANILSSFAASTASNVFTFASYNCLYTDEAW